MRRYECVFATTHVDRHHERIELSGLESLVEAAKASFVPIIVEHDPRHAPIGRVVDARIEQLDDGEHAILGVLEMFDDGEEVPFDRSRMIPLRTHEPGRIQIGFDRTYRDAESQEIIKEISTALGSSPVEDGKKALEPISILVIGAGVALGAMAAGFFNAAGADAYAQLKAGVKKLIRAKRANGQDHLLQFDFTVSDGQYVLDLEVIFTNPSPDDLEYAFGQMLIDLERSVAEWFVPSLHIRRVVFEASGRALELRFGVRADGVPLQLPLASDDEFDVAEGSEESG